VGGTSSVMFAQLPSERLTKKTAESDDTPMKLDGFSKEELEKMRQ